MTTDTKGVHPMVLKAARAWCDSIADRAGVARDGYWANWKDDCIASAQAALTECGALECLNALNSLSRHVERMREAGLVQCDDIGPEDWARELLAAQAQAKGE